MTNDERDPTDVVEYETWVEESADAEDTLADGGDGLAAQAPKDEPMRRSRWPLWLSLGALLGFAASFAASWVTRPAPFDPAPLRAELAGLRTEMNALRDRPVPEAARVDLDPLYQRIEALEALNDPPLRAIIDVQDNHITALEELPRADVSEGLVTRLEALRDEGFTAAPPPDLTELEGRLDALEAKPLPGTDISVELEPLEARIAALEARGGPTSAEPRLEPQDEGPSLPSFPGEALRAGVESRRGGLFSKHIRVRSEDDPMTLIEGIEADMAARRPAQAVAKFDRLPPELQRLARGWRADMNSFIP